MGERRDEFDGLDALERELERELAGLVPVPVSEGLERGVAARVEGSVVARRSVRWWAGRGLAAAAGIGLVVGGVWWLTRPVTVPVGAPPARITSLPGRSVGTTVAEAADAGLPTAWALSAALREPGVDVMAALDERLAVYAGVRVRGGAEPVVLY